MKKVDYIIVGLGIAGLSFCEQLRKNSKSFLIFSGEEKPATEVSGGVLNPTVLKRFTLSWRGNEFFNHAINFYKNLQTSLNISIIEEKPIFRIIKSVEEQNDWIVASDKKELGIFLESTIQPNKNSSIITSFGLGKVKHTAMIDTSLLLNTYRKTLVEENLMIDGNFDYSKLIQNDNGTFSYNEYTSDKILFAEGASAVKNPFFPKNYIVGNKGEYIIVNAPQLKLDAMLKGPMFIIPLGDDLYKIGATYKRDDYSKTTTEEAKNEISSKVKQMIHCHFEVIDQVAGTRPTIKDRKPILGNLDNNNMYFFNGLGTRGLTMAPLLAEELFHCIEDKTPISSEVNIRRFK